MQIQTSTSAESQKTMQFSFIFQISNILVLREERTDYYRELFEFIRHHLLISLAIWYLIHYLYIFQIIPDTSSSAGCLLQLLCCGHGDTIVTPTVVSLILPRHMSRINITASLALWHKVWHFCDGVTKWAARHATLLHPRKSEKKFSSVKKWAPSLPKNCLVFAARGEEGK